MTEEASTGEKPWEAALLPEPEPRTTVQDHVEMSHRFLDHAQTELNAGRRLQPPEPFLRPR